MDLITLDFETFYSKDFSLTKMTTEEYVRDPRFEIVGVGIKVNNGDTEWASERTKSLKGTLTGLTGLTVWCWLTTLCSMALYYLGYLIFALGFGLILFVLPVLYMGWKLVEVSRRSRNDTI